MNLLFAIFEEVGVKVKDFIKEWVDKGYNWFIALDWWIQAIIIIGAAVLLVLGLIKFVQISWKLFIVLIVLAAIAAAVYYLVIKPEETETTTEVVEAATTAFGFLNLLF